MTVSHYEMGTFKSIESPIIFPESCTESEWASHIAKAGYRQTDAFGLEGSADIEIYHRSNLQADSDYPYFVMVDLCGEGRSVFMTNIWNVTHFINNHAAFAAYNLLTFIHSSVNEMHRQMEKTSD